MEVRFVSFGNLKPHHRNFVKETCGRLLPVLNSSAFERDAVSSSMTQNKGSRPARILQIFKSGVDGRGVIELDIMSFHSFSNTIAYSVYRTLKHHYNEKFLEEYYQMPRTQGQAKMAKTIVHEIMHDPYGFKHPWYSNKEGTVPYVYGKITERNFLKFYELDVSKSGFVEMGSPSLVEANISFSFVG